jgi:hypothetical protein
MLHILWIMWFMQGPIGCPGGKSSTPQEIEGERSVSVGGELVCTASLISQHDLGNGNSVHYTYCLLINKVFNC